MKYLLKRMVKLSLIAVVGGLLLIQLAPYGRNHTNPAITGEPDWNSPQTRELARRACFDCHSNETVWPWYSHVAPISWLIQHDTDEGRATLNFSTWNNGGQGEETDEVVEVIAEGEMPPMVYLVTHPEARLTAAEKQALMEGLRATIFR